MHQMQLSYDATQDRMLFRVNTRERQEFRFWMTRRYIAILWQTLTGLIARLARDAPDPVPSPAPSPVAEKPPLPDPLAAEAKQELLHRQAVERTDFKTEYQETNYLPLGETPILLFGVSVRTVPDGRLLLCMQPENGPGIEISVDEPIVRSLCQLLLNTTAKADWNLKLTFLPSTAPGDTSPQKGLS